MIDSFIAVWVDLLDDSVADDLWKVQVMLHHLDADVIFVGTGNQTHEYRAQIGHQDFLSEIRILVGNEILYNYRMGIENLDLALEFRFQTFKDFRLFEIRFLLL